jgi:large subunit ribosomal protein L4
MEISLKNQKGENIGEIELDNEFFGLEPNLDLIHQVITILRKNQRRPIAHTKDRGEVRGGGRKPWVQKGTGRARHGSIRSPLWKGGGVTFGPRKEKKLTRKLPKKIKRKALFMILSEKARQNLILLLDKIEVSKTKEAKELLKNLGLQMTKDQKLKESVLVILSDKEKEARKFFENLAKVKVIEAKDINALILVSYKYLLLTKETLDFIKKHFSKK